MATAKLYTDKSATTAADLLNDRVVPYLDEQGIRAQRVLANRGYDRRKKWRDTAVIDVVVVLEKAAGLAV